MRKKTMLKNWKENSADLTMQETVLNQRVVISLTQPRSVKSTWIQEHVGENTVVRDILKYVATVADALEENCVATCTLTVRAIAVMNSHQKSITVSSAQKAFVNIVLLRKPMSRILMK